MLLRATPTAQHLPKATASVLRPSWNRNVTAISKLKPTVAQPTEAPAPTTAAPDFGALPDAAYVRASELIRSAKNPAAPLPFSPSTLWRLVKEGKFPAPLKLGIKTSAWQVGHVRRWLTQQEAER